MKIMTL